MSHLDEQRTESAVLGDQMTPVGQPELTLLGIEEIRRRRVRPAVRRFPWPALALTLALLTLAYLVFEGGGFAPEDIAVAADNAPIVAAAVGPGSDPPTRSRPAVVSASLLPLRSSSAKPVEPQAHETGLVAYSRPLPISSPSRPASGVGSPSESSEAPDAEVGLPPSDLAPVEPPRAFPDSVQKVGSQPSAGAASADTFKAQLASRRSMASAWATWELLSEQNADLLGALSAGVEAANVSGRGTYYRLRVGEFDEAAEARTLCAALASRSLDCLVVSY